MTDNRSSAKYTGHLDGTGVDVVVHEGGQARPDHVEPSYTNLGGTASSADALERPQGGTFNHNGTLVFFLNNRIDHTDQVTVMRLSTPYDLRTASRVFEGGDPIIDIAGGSGDSRVTLDIDFNNDGTKLFLTNVNGKVFPFDLKIQYSFHIFLCHNLKLVFLYLVYIGIITYFSPSSAPAMPSEMIKEFKEKTSITNIINAFLLPFILIFAVLGSIFMGIASPTEAAGIGAAGALLLSVIQGSINLKKIKDGI